MSPRSRLREERFVRSYLTNGDTLVDVGANIGTIAFAGAAAVGASGRVIAIEPHPRTFACLLENGELNGFTNVRYCNRAVGASRGTVGFSNRPDDDQNRVLEGGTIRVEATTLDALLEELGVVSVALLKIDVEGYEKHVLQGAERALARTQCVLIETVERNLSSFGTSSGEILQMLRAHGFRLFRVDHRLEEAVAARDPDGLMARIGALELTEL